MLIGNRKKSDLISILVLGFGFLFMLLAFYAYTSHKQIDQSQLVIKGSSLASEKMELIVRQIETVRIRTRLTLKLIYEEDPFIKDEIAAKLDAYAARFVATRRQLIAIGLNDEEMTILEKQKEFIAPTLEMQRKAVEMAMSKDPARLRKAQKLMLEGVYEGQGKIVDYFLQLLNYEKNRIDKARQESNHQYRLAQNLQWALFGVITIIAMAVAFYVIRRTISTEYELFLEKEKAQITLKSIGDAVITTNNKGEVAYLNPMAEKITGYSTHEVEGNRISEVFKAYDEGNERWLADNILDFLQNGNYRMSSTDIVLYNADNDIIDISQTMAPIQGEDNKVLGTITTFQDITKAKIMAKHIEHQALHDVLTGLLNRREFENKVVQSLALYSGGAEHALAVMDLDRFKIVNDTLGHAAGDELLRQVSQIISKQLRQNDFLSRIGGDEFALFLSNIDTQSAIKIAEKILVAVREYQFVWGDKAFRVAASIGLVDAPAQISNYENLYHAADTACYMAKHEGRNRVHVVSYDDVDISEKREQTQWVSRINDALENNMFTLYVQDIVPLSDNPDLKPHREVLIRMLDGDGGIIPPMAFIPPAERFDLMPSLDLWVINNVVEHINNNQTENMVYAINLSGQSLADKKFTQKAIEIINLSKIDHKLLCFEITETAAIANMENASSFLKSLQGLGCYTALDDFGSGLSSFAYLRNLPIDYLKIDGMFVKQIADDETSRVMVDAINSIGKTMQLKTIAEFVENEDTLKTLKDIGVDYAQGYFFGAPEPIE